MEVKEAIVGCGGFWVGQIFTQVLAGDANFGELHVEKISTLVRSTQISMSEFCFFFF